MSTVNSFLNYELDSAGNYQLVTADSSKLVCGFLEYKRIEAGASDLTLESYGYDLKHFCNWLSGYRKKTALYADCEDVRKYLDECWRLNPKPSTVAHRITVLREFFNHLQRDRLLSRDPMIRIASVKQWKRLPKPITEAEVQQLLAAPDVPTKKVQPRGEALQKLRAAKQPAIALRDVAICEVLYAGGLRASELIGAKLQDLDPTVPCLRVIGKGDKERIVPLGLPAVRALRDYLTRARPQLAGGNPSPYLFIGERCKQLTRQRLWQIIKERGKRANLTHLSPHVLRHSLATHMLDRGADLRVIQTILGHADIGTTELYTKVSQERLKEAIRMHHPRSNPSRAQLSLFPTTALALVPSFVSNPCEECAAPSVPGKTRCARHLLQAKEARAKLHAARIAAGLCANCRRPALPGKTRCEEHAIADREAVKRYERRKHEAMEQAGRIRGSAQGDGAMRQMPPKKGPEKQEPVPKLPAKATAP